eukprot:6814870-Ditylum_brightwellii.AAC.1
MTTSKNNEVKQSIEASQKRQEEMLQNINAKLEQKGKDQKASIRLLVKELLQEELKKIIPDIVEMILSQTKVGVNNIINGIKDAKTKSTSGNTEDTVSVVTTAVLEGKSQKTEDEIKILTPEDKEELLTQEQTKEQEVNKGGDEEESISSSSE